MSSETVVLCYPVSDEDTEKIRATFKNCQVLVSSQKHIARDIMSADIFCGHAKVPIDWPQIVANGKLKWIQSSAAGMDHCLVPSVVESDIVVSGCSGLFANQVAEQTLALLYASIRRLPVFFQAQQHREFVRQPTDVLYNKTVSIIGFGGNGRRIAELLRGAVKKIVVTDTFHEFDIPKYVSPLPATELDLAFEMADIAIVTLPLTRKTQRYIGRAQFSRLKPGSYFLNVARGAIVDHEALLAAIDNGTIGYAGLDVVDPEPLPVDSRMWDMPNIIITPHVGAQSPDRVSATTELFCLNQPRFQQSQILVNQIDKTLEFPLPEHRPKIAADGDIQIPPTLM